MRKLRTKHIPRQTQREMVLTQIESSVLRLYYPGASPGKIKRLRTLAREKGVPIVVVPERPSNHLDRIMASIVRHETTGYDDMLGCGLHRDNARGLIQPIVSNEMKRIKGGG